MPPSHASTIRSSLRTLLSLPPAGLVRQDQRITPSSGVSSRSSPHSILSLLASVWASLGEASLWWTDSVCGACRTRRRTHASTTAATLRASSDCLPPRVGTTRVGPAVAKLPRFRLAPMSSLRRHVNCLTQSAGPGLRDERRLYS